jgi:hypothetical protein
LGGFGEFAFVVVGWALTIPQLPLGGFKQLALFCGLSFDYPPAFTGGIVYALLK